MRHYAGSADPVIRVSYPVCKISGSNSPVNMKRVEGGLLDATQTKLTMPDGNIWIILHYDLVKIG